MTRAGCRRKSANRRRDPGFRARWLLPPRLCHRQHALRPPIVRLAGRHRGQGGWSASVPRKDVQGWTEILEVICECDCLAIRVMDVLRPEIIDKEFRNVFLCKD